MRDAIARSGSRLRFAQGLHRVVLRTANPVLACVVASALLAGCGGSGSAESVRSASPTPAAAPTSAAAAPDLPPGVTPIVSGLTGSDLCSVLPRRPSGYWVLDCSGIVTEVTAAGEKLAHQRLDGGVANLGPLHLLAGAAVLPLVHGEDGGHLTYSVALFDTARGTLRSQVNLGDSTITSVAVVDDIAYVGTLDGDVVEFDPQHPTVVAVAKFPKPLSVLAGTASAVWGASGGGAVSRFDLASRTAVSVTDRVVRRVTEAAVVNDELWISSVAEGSLSRVSPEGAVTSLDVPGSTISMVLCGGTVWLAQTRLGGEYGASSGLRQLGTDGSVRRVIEVPDGIGNLACHPGDTLVGIAGVGTLVTVS